MNYKKTLLNKPYWYYDCSQEKFISSSISKKDIGYATETIGTKFYKDIAGIENPKKILKLIKNKFAELNSNNEVSWVDKNGEKRFSFSFEYDFPVGDKNVLSINELSDIEKKNIKSIFRSRCAGENNIIVNTITGIRLQSTRIIYVEMLKTNQLPFLAITAFPKCLAKDIPDNELVFAI